MGKILLAFVITLSWLMPVMAGTWTSNNFLYKPASGARGADEKAKFDSGLNRVDSRLANEKWLNDSAYNGDFNTAVDAIGNAKTILSIPAGNWSITENLTVPANLTVKFAHGALLTIPTGKTLTMNGPIEAQPYQIFACTGTGKVVIGSQKVVYPEWWGAVINAPGTDCGPALNRAIAALTANAVPITNYKGGSIEFQAGTYYISTQVNLASDVTFKGYGGMSGSGTILQRSADITMFSGLGVSILNPAFNQNQILRVSFESINFMGQAWGASTYTADMFNLKACKNFKWSNCQLSNIYGRAINTWELFDSRFEDCYFQWSGNAAALLPVVEFKSAGVTYETTNNIYFTGCVFEANRFTCIKTTGTTAAYPTGQLYFVNTKFDNTDLTGPTLDLLNCQDVRFSNAFAWIQRNIAITEIVKFDRCNHVSGNLHLAITNVPVLNPAAITRVMTIITDPGGGAWDCHMDLFLSGTNWDAITEAAAVNLDSVVMAAKINIRTYGGTPRNAGWLCSNKALTNMPQQSEALYGSSFQAYLPRGGSSDWVGIFVHELTAGGPDVWVNRIIESGPSTYMEWVLNNIPLFRLIYGGVVQVITGDLQIAASGKGVILTNAAGTVTKRVRLNDAGNGLIFEAP